MPNWCTNTLTLTHDDPQQIQRVKEAFLSEKLLETFFPNTGDPDAWYKHNTSNWGTKWDVGDKHAEFDDDPNTVTLHFDSAWSPPVAAYSRFEELGFTVNASYYEPGMAYAGTYSDGFDDCYEYGNMSAQEIRDSLPQELDEQYCISDYVEEWEQEEELRQQDEEDESEPDDEADEDQEKP